MSTQESSGYPTGANQENNLGLLPIEVLIDMTETTYPIKQLDQELKSALKQTGVDQNLLDDIEVRPSPEGVTGDFGFHCAPLAKRFKRNPAQIAQEIAEQLPVNRDGILESYTAVGPYTNAAINYERFGNLVKDSIFEMGVDYGKETIGAGQRIVIDMSSPNIAKRMSIGHLRSTIIGDSLARILSHLDFEVIKDNHLGDWGTQFGKQIAGIDMWSSEEELKNSDDPIGLLQETYIRYEAEIFSEKIDGLVDALNNGNKEAWETIVKLVELSERDDIVPGDVTSTFIKELIKSNEEIVEDDSFEKQKRVVERYIGGFKSVLEDRGREYFLKLEDGNPKIRRMWQTCVDVSLKEFQKMYDVLGVQFDWTRGESYYEDMLSDTIQKVRESGIGTESDGALVVNMEDVGLGIAIIQKSDGATLYLTREIATGTHRNDIEGANGMIYVVGEDQKFYFQQFFEILRRMDYPIANRSNHVYFGMIRLPEGKMSTRKGRVVLLEDVITEAFDRTRQLVEARTHVTTPQERENLIRQVAVGALKWNDLMADPRRSIVFDWDAMLSMEGNSAPYVQYTYARAASLLKNTDLEEIRTARVLPGHDAEKTLITLVAEFPEIVKAAAQGYNPSKIASHIYELAKTFNIFYHDLSVLRAESEEKKRSRLALTACAAQTIQTGLELLGIETPTRM